MENLPKKSEFSNGKPTPPPWLRPLSNNGHLDCLDKIIEQGGKLAEIKVWRYMTGRCERYFMPGFWEGRARIEAATGLSESSVRRSLDWLEAHGWITRETVMIQGVDQVVMWCLWLLPSDWVTRQFLPDAPRPRVHQPRFSARSAIPGAPQKTGQYRKGVRKEKTTDRERGVVVVLSAAPGEEDKQVIPPPAPPAPAPDLPPLDPRIEAAIGQVESEADRAEVRSLAPIWSAEFAVAVVVATILALRKQRAKAEPISDLGAWLAGVLRNQKAKADATASKKSTGPAKREPTAEEIEARRSKAEAEAKAEADKQLREATLKARWESMSEADREPIRVRVKAENPFLWRRGGMLELMCIAALGDAGGQS